MENCERLFFEVLERALRFWSHVEESCNNSARPEKRKTAQDAISVTLKVKVALIIERLISVFLDDELSDTNKIRCFEAALNDLALNHESSLSAVPRPHEPIEIVSYVRQALEQMPGGASNFHPHVFATENLGDQAHARFDNLNLGEFLFEVELSYKNKYERLNSLLSVLKNESDENVEDLRQNQAEWKEVFKIEDDAAPGYISLPRIDLKHPLRWPSLMHEIGHFSNKGSALDSYLDELMRQHDNIIVEATIEHVSNYFKNEGAPLNSDAAKSTMLKWLVECYCDAYSVSAAGVPAFFSQLHSFLFCKRCYLTQYKPHNDYPPAWFRLKLIQDLIHVRHSSDSISDEKARSMVSHEWDAIYDLFRPQKNADISFNNELNSVFLYFRYFIRDFFPKDGWHDHSDLAPDKLESLISDLEIGLPIPTHRGFDSKGLQTRTTHAEILLAGWEYRNTKLKESLIQKVRDPDFQLTRDFKDLIALVDRADSSLQMSIQVSEWFSILKDPPQKVLDAREETGLDGNIGLISDHEIRRLLLNNSLRIVPLIGGTGGIEGTSVDIRLGHNFEIFFTNVNGSVDALENNSVGPIDSMEVDFDSTEGLEIAPGQFVLGHTLEYLKLPSNVAVEINGRSSFARLGIQIHMTAPFVDAGFDGCLTLEISNSGHSSVKLYPGMRIAQLRFIRCSSSPEVSYAKKDGVKYRGRLRHNKTKQFSDWEIGAFQKERKRRTL